MDRLDSILAQLNIRNGLLSSVHHVPGAFIDFVRDFDVAEFAREIGELGPTQGNGQVWYLDDEHHRGGKLPSHIDDLKLPLPAWARDVQLGLLTRLNHQGAYGWSAVLFWAEQNGASVGEHVDNEDVYTIQIFGRKEWVIDPPSVSQLEGVVRSGDMARLNPSESWVKNRDHPLSFLEATTVVMNPGDFLAMPAFALHRVTTLSDGYNLSFNASICQEQVWARHAAGKTELADVVTLA